ncbi:hypothetical protein CERSUDRAFT_37152, partial [Gelatoporia subvermispora B]
CAIFSTYDIVSAARLDDGGALSRSIQWTGFWERPIWLIPVHREGAIGHWTIVIADVPKATFYHFDSLANVSLWKSDVRRAFHLI